MKFLLLSFACVICFWNVSKGNSRTETAFGLAGPIYIAASSMKLHQARSTTSTVVMEIPRGSEVKVLNSRFGNWWQVQYKTKIGYVQRTYLKYSTVNDLTDFDPVYNSSSLYNSKPSYVLQSEQELFEHQSSTSAILTKLPKGAQVKVIDSTNDSWWLVHYKGRTGNIRSNDLNPAESRPQQGTAVSVKKLSLVPKGKPTHTTTTSLSMRESMSTTAAVLFQIPQGAPVVVVNPDFNHWAQIEFAGKTGYVTSGNFAALTDESSHATANSPTPGDSNRASASKPAQEENAAKPGANVYATAKGPTESTTTHSLTAETSLRATPDSQAKVLTRFAVGDQVTILDDSGEWWWEVTFQGKRGWVKRRLLVSGQ